MLLNFQQFRNEVPDSPLYHLPSGMLILYRRSNVPTSSFEGLADPPLSMSNVLTSSFEGLADPPLSIEKWNSSSRMLERVSAEVWYACICDTCILYNPYVQDLHVQLFLLTGVYCTPHSPPSKGKGCWKASCDGTHHCLQ